MQGSCGDFIHFEKTNVNIEGTFACNSDKVDEIL